MNVPKKYLDRILLIEPETDLIDECKYLLTFAPGWNWNGETSVPCRNKREVMQFIREAEQD